MKALRYRLEALLVSLLLLVFEAVRPETASQLGGWLGRSIGPKLAVNRRALKHLKAALPGKSDAAYQKIIVEMWDNLGRTVAEYPHLETLAQRHVEFVGMERLTEKSPAILIAGHLANWEMAATSFYVRGVPIDLIYRAPNNGKVDAMLKTYRSLRGKIKTYPKSSAGMRQVVTALNAKHNLGILIDQKYNQGVQAPFFGLPAMTSPAFAQLAQKYKCPLYPVRVERLQGCEFRVTCFDPLDTSQPLEKIIADAQALLETWIGQRPGQWIWLHRRWKEAKEPVERSETLAEDLVIS